MASLGTFLSIAIVVFGRTLSDAILLTVQPTVNVANFFIYSSLALMTVSVIYFRLLRAISATKLNAGFLLVFAAATFLFNSIQTTEEWFIQSYSTFLITAPALGNIIVWNAIGDAFNARQGRRLFHIVCAASTCGGIFAGFLLPFMQQYLGFSVLTYTYAALFMLITVPVVILHRNRRAERTVMTIAKEKSNSLIKEFLSGFDEFIRSPLIRNLCIVFFLTAVTTNVIDFSLKYYLQINYDQEGIVNFYGLFNAISNTFNLIVQLTLLSSFLTRFRTRTLFAITPLVLLGFTAPFIFIYSAVCVVLMRFMDVALRFVIQDAAREIALSPLPRLLRNRAKVIFKGVMNPLGGISAGIILNFIAPVIGTDHLPLLVIPISLASIWCIKNLNKYCANHLYSALQSSARKEGILKSETDHHDDETDLELEPFENPQNLVDPDGNIRSAALDAILVLKSHDEDAATTETVRQYTASQLSRDLRLAHAALVISNALDNDCARKSSLSIHPIPNNAAAISDEAPSLSDTSEQMLQDVQNNNNVTPPSQDNTIIVSNHNKLSDINLSDEDRLELLSQLSDVYNEAFQRVFKGLMLLYKSEILSTIYKSLTSSRASTRAQALELLQLTISDSPLAKSMLILCDDFDNNEKCHRLNDHNPLSYDEAMDILKAEDSRTMRKLIAKLKTTETVDLDSLS